MEDRIKYEIESDEENDDCDDIDQFCDDESYYEDNDKYENNTSGKSRRKFYEDLKNSDTGYFCISKNVKGKNYKIEMYNSGVTIGNKIRDAITGTYSNYKIGSNNEDLFFKVRMPTGIKNNNVTLFYYCISDFEKHQKTIVSDTVKRKWIDKKNFRESKLREVSNKEYTQIH